MVNSRAKGARGEREFAKWLRERGHEARRGQQFAGGTDSPDVVSDIGVHLEVKRTERLCLWDAVDQASRDCGGKPWAIPHRKNGRDWVVIVDAEEWLRLIEGMGNATA